MKNKMETKYYRILHNCETRDEQKIVSFNGNIEEYYMVDYFDRDECRWVRSPFNTIQEVANIASYINDGKKVDRFRVIPEKWLSELRDKTWDEEKSEYEKDTITNRTNLFGYRYDLIAEGITGIKSLSEI